MKKWFVKFFKNEKGINTVEIVVLVAIAIGLALLFRDRITAFIEAIFKSAFNPGDIVPTSIP